MSKVFRRCGCRSAAGKTYPPLPDQPTAAQVARACPKMVTDAKHGRWSFRLSAGVDPVTKRRRQVSGETYATKSEATRARNAMVVQLDHGKVPSADRVTLAEFLPGWLKRAATTGTSRSRKPLAEKTLENYRRYAEFDIAPSALGAMMVRDIRRRHVQHFIDELAAQRGAVTVHRVVAVLQGALSSAVRDELIEASPAHSLDLPAVAAKRFEPWSLEQVGAFLDAAAGHRLSPLFEVALQTGLRRGELLALRWVDVDLAGRELTVRRSKTEAGVRRVPLSDHAVSVLLEWQTAQADERTAAGPAYVGDGAGVFTMPDGKPLRPEFPLRNFDRIQTGLDAPRVNFHALRHLCASVLLASGASIEHVSKVLGHSDVRVTSAVYSHLLPGSGQAHADRAAALIPRGAARTLHAHQALSDV